MFSPKKKQSNDGAKPNNHRLKRPLVQRKETPNESVNAKSVTSILGRQVIFATKGTSQAKLKVGAPDDKFEKEADAVADQVTNAKTDGINQKAAPSPIQTKRVTGSDLQTKPNDVSSENQINLESEAQEETELEPQKSVQLKTKTTDGKEAVPNQISISKGGGNKMDSNTRSEMESGFGHDFGDVKIHTDQKAIDSSTALGAKAFTSGNDIYFNQGEYQPNSKNGKHLLAHELTHTLQQGARAKSDVQRKVDPDIQTIDDDERNLLVKADELTDIYYNDTLLAYFNAHYFDPYSHVYSDYRENVEIMIFGTVKVGEEEFKVTFYYDPIYKSYWVKQKSLSKEAKDRDLNSKNYEDWLTPEGKVEYRAMNQHFAKKEAVEWSQLKAPLGMVILMKRNDLYFLIDNKYKLAIGYTDYKAYKKTYGHTKGIIYIKRHERRSGKDMGPAAQEIFIAPDQRFVYENADFDPEKKSDEPEETISERSGRNHFITGFNVSANHYPNLMKLEEARKGKRDWSDSQIILTIHLFNDYETGWFKEHSKLKQFVKKRLSAEQMAWAVTPLNPSVISLNQKLGFINRSSMDGKVDVEAIRPILQQYSQSRPFNSVLERSNSYQGHDNIKISYVKKQVKNYKSEKSHSFKVGEYDDSRDESAGIFGLSETSVQDGLYQMSILTPAYLALKRKDRKLAQAELDKVKDITSIETLLEFEWWLSLKESWFVKFFRDNALKMGFTVLNITEDALVGEMESYQSGKILELERDFAAIQGTMEEGQEMLGKLFTGGSTDRGTASRWFAQPPSELYDLVTKKHPYLLDIEYAKGNYNWATQLISIYLKYKYNPSSFHAWLEAQMLESIGTHLEFVYETRGNLRNDPEFVWELEEVVKLTSNYLNLGDESMFKDFLEEKLKDIESAKFWTNIGLAAGAVVLGVLSAGFGTAVIAGVAGVSATTVATGAAVGGVVISTYDVYMNYQHYSRQHAAANINSSYSPLSGLTENDPSLLWLGIAIAGMGLDLGAAIKAFKLLSPAAKSLDEGADALRSFDDVLEELTKTQKVLNSAQAEKLAQKAVAQKEMSDAWEEFVQSWSYKPNGSMYSSLPFGAQTVALTKYAVKSIKAGIKTVDEFIAHLAAKQKLGKLSKEIDFENLTKEQLEALDGIFKKRTPQILGVKDVDEYLSHFEKLEIEIRQPIEFGGDLMKRKEVDLYVLGRTKGSKVEGGLGRYAGTLNLKNIDQIQTIQQGIPKRIIDKYPNSYIDQTKAYWEEINGPWLDEAIENGSDFRFIHDPRLEKNAVHQLTEKERLKFPELFKNIKEHKTYLYFEYNYLLKKGYVLHENGLMIKNNL